jgi:hypothetical protein
MRREDRPFISSHPLADLGGHRDVVLLIAVSVSVQFLGSCHKAVPSSRSAVAAGRRAQQLSRLAALCGHPQGLVLTVPSTVPRSCKLGRRRTRLHAFECALLVENRPCNAGKLVGQRNRQHFVVQSPLAASIQALSPYRSQSLVLTNRPGAACANRTPR